MKFLLSALLVFALAAPAHAAGDEDKAAATQALIDYFNAVITLDTQRVVRYCHEPFTFVSTGLARSLVTRADLDSWLKPGFAALKERGYARSEWPQLNVKLLSNGVAIASALIVRYKTDGQEMERVGATYLLRKTDDGWKVAVLAAHDASNVPKLD